MNTRNDSIHPHETDDERDPFLVIVSPSSIEWPTFLINLIRSLFSSACYPMGCHNLRSYPPHLSIQALDGSSWQAQLSIVFLGLLSSAAKPLSTMGRLLETYLNIVRVNGGFLKTLFKLVFLTGLRVPSPDSSEWLSVVGNTDLRVNLMDKTDTSSPESKEFAWLCALASKLAYENESVITSTVNHTWKMQFIKFYNCWNDRLSTYTTQGFAFKDKARNAELIMVAFRGTEPFHAEDWSTDLDFSWYSLGGLGRVHVGFLEALGLANRCEMETFFQLKKNCYRKAHQRNHTHFTSGLPVEVCRDPSKPLAFEEISNDVMQLLQANPKARFCMTGHSLGGALAVLFTAILGYQRDEHILNRTHAIYTFGQPRIGDEDVAEFMRRGVLEQYKIQYRRVVYSNDVVPRVPADNSALQFKHIGKCCYVNFMYKMKVIPSEPNKNYLNPWDIGGMYILEVYELVRSLVVGLVSGSDLRETKFSSALRILAFPLPGLVDHSMVNYINSVFFGPSYIPS